MGVCISRALVPEFAADELISSESATPDQPLYSFSQESVRENYSLKTYGIHVSNSERNIWIYGESVNYPNFDFITVSSLSPEITAATITVCKAENNLWSYRIFEHKKSRTLYLYMLLADQANRRFTEKVFVWIENIWKPEMNKSDHFGFFSPLTLLGDFFYVPTTVADEERIQRNVDSDGNMLLLQVALDWKASAVLKIACPELKGKGVNRARIVGSYDGSDEIDSKSVLIQYYADKDHHNGFAFVTINQSSQSGTLKVLTCQGAPISYYTATTYTLENSKVVIGCAPPSISFAKDLRNPKLYYLVDCEKMTAHFIGEFDFLKSTAVRWFIDEGDLFAVALGIKEDTQNEAERLVKLTPISQ